MVSHHVLRQVRLLREIVARCCHAALQGRDSPSKRLCVYVTGAIQRIYLGRCPTVVPLSLWTKRIDKGGRELGRAAASCLPRIKRHNGQGERLKSIVRVWGGAMQSIVRHNGPILNALSGSTRYLSTASRLSSSEYLEQ